MPFIYIRQKKNKLIVGIDFPGNGFHLITLCHSQSYGVASGLIVSVHYFFSNNGSAVSHFPLITHLFTCIEQKGGRSIKNDVLIYPDNIITRYDRSDSGNIKLNRMGNGRKKQNRYKDG